MKQLFTLMALVLYCAGATAQTEPKKDSIRVGNMIIITNGSKPAQQDDTDKKAASASNPSKPGDSIRVGNMIIVNNGEKNSEENRDHYEENYEGSNRRKRSNVSTNWIILDLGFANFSDKTNYANTGGYLYNRPGAAPLGANDFNLNVGKSIDVNIWLFMQKLNLIDHHLNLKYGLGIELNNYRYNSSVSYLKENPFVSGVTPSPVIIRDSISFKKNKLATDYVTVPFMLNYSSNPEHNNRGFSISLGVSAGYLYSSRNKQVSDQRGKKVNNGGFDIEQFKFSYVGEIGLGPVRLYGSYSPKSIYKTGLDMRPYNLGIRLSNW